jgi:hypothetical protein
MSTKYRVLCGVPVLECLGSGYITTQALSKKAHASRVEAFRCMRKHLMRQGFTQIGPREFRPPDGGPIRVLTKKARFGGLLRQGKAGEEGGMSSSRFMPDMPKKRTQGTVY